MNTKDTDPQPCNEEISTEAGPQSQDKAKPQEDAPEALPSPEEGASVEPPASNEAQDRERHNWVLSDDELMALKGPGGDSLIHPVVQTSPSTHNPNSGTYILHIDKVYQGLPLDSSEDTLGKQFSNEGADKLTMKPGDLAFIRTTETITMPPDCIGIVFGTNSMTQSGVLVVNPGYITAGHKAPISFVVVNFRRHRKNLAKGDAIARLLVVRFPGGNHAGDFLTPSEFNHDRELAHFSRDFGGVMKGTMDEAARVFRRSLFRDVVIAGVAGGILLATIAALFVGIQSALTPFVSGSSPVISELRQKVDTMEKDVKSLQVDLAVRRATDRGHQSDGQPAQKAPPTARPEAGQTAPVQAAKKGTDQTAKPTSNTPSKP